MTDYMKLAERMAKSSDCRRKQTGAVIVKNDVVRAKGYNHLPYGTPEGFCKNCPRENKTPGNWNGSQECPVIHAEIAAIQNAAMLGRQTDTTTMYCTYKPCLTCAIAIVEVGIRKVVYRDDYEGDDAIEYLRKCGVEVEQYKQDPIIIYNPDEGVIE